MKKNLQVMVLAALIGASGMMTSCGKDDLESVVVKRSGSLIVTIRDGETPVADTKVRFYNENSENEIDVFITDANGTVNFGELNEGVYSVSFEVKSPKYALIKQEIQVISGQAANKTIQVTDYVGNMVVSLTDYNTDEVVTEDVGLGLAFVPDNDALERTRTDEEIFALANEVKYFGTAGEISVDLPIGSYDTYVVRGDSIISWWDDFTLVRQDEKFARYEIDPVFEKLANKVHWSVESAIDELGATVEDFPISSIRFYSNGSWRVEIALDNDVVFSGSVSLYDDYFYIGNRNSSSDDYYFYSGDVSYEFDVQGNLILTFYSFDIIHSGDDDFDEDDFTVTLK